MHVSEEIKYEIIQKSLAGQSINALVAEYSLSKYLVSKFLQEEHKERTIFLYENCQSPRTLHTWLHFWHGRLMSHKGLSNHEHFIAAMVDELFAHLSVQLASPTNDTKWLLDWYARLNDTLDTATNGFIHTMVKQLIVSLQTNWSMQKHSANIFENETKWKANYLVVFNRLLSNMSRLYDESHHQAF